MHKYTQRSESTQEHVEGMQKYTHVYVQVYTAFGVNTGVNIYIYIYIHIHVEGMQKYTYVYVQVYLYIQMSGLLLGSFLYRG